MKFLVTTDGSERSLQVLPHAGRLARSAGATIELARVLDPHNDATHVRAPSRNEAVDQVRVTWQGEMEAALAAAGVPGETVIVTRAQREEIEDSLLRYAEKAGVGLIAIDTRGSGTLRHLFFGSTALGTLSKTDVPVFVTGPEIGPLPPEDNIYHVLVTYDGSPASRTVAHGIAPLLERGDIRLTVLQIWQPSIGDQSETAEVRQARESSEQFSELFPERTAVDVVAKAIPGNRGIDAAVLDAAADTNADAIAMATHGHSALRRAVAGSVAIGVLGKSTLPVLLVRHRG